MTLKEQINFYSQNKKDYIVKNNKELIDWIEEQKRAGYKFNTELNIHSIQSLINHIVRWYEIKYPDDELKALEDRKEKLGLDNLIGLANEMTFWRLLCQIPESQSWLINCKYRAKNFNYELIFISIYYNNPKKREKVPLILTAYKDSGEIIETGDNTKTDKKLTLKDFYRIFNSEYRDEYDLSELKECLFNYKCDLELRNKILQLVALKLLYSKRDTYPEMSYLRAKRFISEFNKELKINLSTDEIDEIMKRDYDYQEKPKKRRLFQSKKRVSK